MESEIKDYESILLFGPTDAKKEFSNILKFESASWIESVSMQQKISIDEIQSKKYGYFPKFDRHMMTYNSELKIELDKFIKTLN